ncbi:hypothetical protein FHG87_022053 [Trinorchestia longiramus]|nr:hypothetical protein FHG87_022053 [Trinorchestia longiramus]
MDYIDSRRSAVPSSISLLGILTLHSDFPSIHTFKYTVTMTRIKEEEGKEEEETEEEEKEKEEEEEEEEEEDEEQGKKE